jgi:hypothetical protein
MPFRSIVLILGATVTFILGALVSWYEGGQLLDNPWEWKHTAVFSNWIQDGDTNADNILAIDHFVYAAKFEPLFPLLMAASFLWLVWQLAFWLFKRQRAARNVFLVLLAALSFSMSGVFYDSPTTGLRLFSVFFGIVGLLSVYGVFRFRAKRSSFKPDL